MKLYYDLMFSQEHGKLKQRFSLFIKKLNIMHLLLICVFLIFRRDYCRWIIVIFLNQMLQSDSALWLM